MSYCVTHHSELRVGMRGTAKPWGTVEVMAIAPGRATVWSRKFGEIKTTPSILADAIRVRGTREDSTP